MEEIDVKQQPRRKRSIYWNYFTETDNFPFGSKAKCDHCSQVLSIRAGCTGNLIRHLRQKHPVILSIIQDNDNAMAETTEVDCETEDGQKYNQVFIVDSEAGISEADDSRNNTSEGLPTKRKRKKLRPYVSRVSKATETYINKEEDRFDIFGRLVALKMRILEKNQRIIAEKIINDALHEGEMNNLNKYCGINVVEIRTELDDCTENVNSSEKT